MDNCHRITDFRFDEVGKVLEMHFDAGGRLLVWNPANYSVGEQQFTIKEASKVRWEWYHYGGTQSRENLYSIEYVKQGSCIQVISGKNGADDPGGDPRADRFRQVRPGNPRGHVDPLAALTRSRGLMSV